MITLIVPTRNRAHVLRLVLPSFYEQAQVDEIIFVDDAGTDDTAAVVSSFSRTYPAIHTLYLRNNERRGAAQSRNAGVQSARNEFILFCDDDMYLEKDYASVCLAKLQTYSAGAVSGRVVYMQDGENREDALRRFGDGTKDTPAFRPLLCQTVHNARFTGDLETPITHAVILTRKSLLLSHPFDPFYARGNGYREESDYQMNLFVNGYKNYITNDCHTLHLPLSSVMSGGQRVSFTNRIYWPVFYTFYFYRKYYARYARRMGLSLPMPIAALAFASYITAKESALLTLRATGLKK